MEPILVLNPPELLGSGYPARHHEVVRRAWTALANIVVVGGLLTGALTVYALFLSGPVLPAAIGAAVYLIALLAGIGGVWDITRYVRIIPLYAAGVGETDTFLYGQAIAREFRMLEALAERAGVTPLSQFGFGDPLQGETLTWHGAEEGLRTVGALREALTPDARALHEDLERWEAALSRAARMEIRFALLLLHGNSTSSLEWERRGGSPF